MKVNRVKDVVERVTWTAIQAAAGSALVVLSSNSVDWVDGAKITGVAALIAACKVLIAQNFGNTDDGAAIPGGVIEKTSG